MAGRMVPFNRKGTTNARRETKTPDTLPSSHQVVRFTPHATIQQEIWTMLILLAFLGPLLINILLWKLIAWDLRVNPLGTPRAGI